MIWWLLIAAGAAAVILLAAYYTYRIAFYAPAKRTEDVYDVPKVEQYDPLKDKMHALIRDMAELPYEAVTIRAKDGTTLFGRYYHLADGAPLQIQFHGYRSSACRDFSGGNKLARKMGHNTLLVDQRCHGKSGGSTITFGIRERWDCLCWAQYAAQRFGKETPIFLSGVSMGAATVLMASDLPLPENVVGIIADCPYSSPEGIIRKVCRDMGYPQAIAYPFVSLGARLFGGLRLRESSAVQSVARTRIPILLIHGEDDRFVPCRMSREIFDAAAGPLTLETFPGAAHAFSYMVDPRRYEQASVCFVEECLQKETAPVR